MENHKEKKLVLVTGATGLLGANVVDKLIKRGYLARAIVRKNSDRAGIRDLECALFEGDINSVVDLGKAIRNCSYVIHCAADTSQSDNRLDKYRAVNIDAVEKLIRVSKIVGIKRFIHVSTTNCFRNGTLDQPGDESGPFQPWLKASGYAYSKYLAQEMVLKESIENAFPAIVVAPSFIIGPRDAKVSSGKMIKYVLSNRLIFYPEGGKSIVDAEFAAEAIVSALEKGRVGETYLLAGENLPLKTLLKKIASIAKKKIFMIPIPQWILIVLSNLLTPFQKIFGFPISLTNVNRRMISMENYYDSAKAEKELGLKKSNADDAIEKAINWFEKRK